MQSTPDGSTSDTSSDGDEVEDRILARMGLGRKGRKEDKRRHTGKRGPKIQAGRSAMANGPTPAGSGGPAPSDPISYLAWSQLQTQEMLMEIQVGTVADRRRKVGL